ncbi:MAG TPA: 4Fe-4S binding protein [Armatimonadota bacterium]|nr:4Fe-4S binding protein [Armatimonadota bacterium]
MSQQGYNAPIIDQAKCIHCGKCIKSCPMGAFVRKS